jgi:hypothetical protein
LVQVAQQQVRARVVQVKVVRLLSALLSVLVAVVAVQQTLVLVG